MVVLDTNGLLGDDDLPPELVDPASLVIEEATLPTTIEVGTSGLIGQSLASIEKWAIEETLRLTGGNREEAAKKLKIGARTLYRRLDDYKTGAEGGGGEATTDDGEDG